MQPYIVDESVTLYSVELLLGDCLTHLKSMPECSVDSIVTDPPYGLSFMGKRWDYDVPSVEIWTECLRVLKPGGHLLAFAGTRTQHRMAVRIEDAGFEIRDMIAWVYGSGFPKSLDVSKAIDKAAGAEREVVGTRKFSATNSANFRDDGWKPDLEKLCQLTAPATDAARQWQGWGTALKPAIEPITVARKPLIGTVAANVLQHGTGALNIDECRVAYEEDCRLLKGGSYGGNRKGAAGESVFGTGGSAVSYETTLPDGRWPANLIHDGSEEVLAGFPESGGSGPARTLRRGQRDGEGWGMADQPGELRDAGTGSAARFFYCAKASKKERCGSKHPTVKPLALMKYLVRLVTPPNGLILDPFAGTGTTGEAAISEGFRFVGIEQQPEYYADAQRRLNISP